MDDMHAQHETPTSDAARGLGQYVTAALAATDLAVRVRTWFIKEAHGKHDLWPGDLERAGEVLDPKRQAYNAMLGRDHRRVDSRTAVLAWVSAQPRRDDDPQAELVAGRAEARLRDLHPDAMTRYDQLRAGLSPVEAMREVVPLVVVEQQHAAARTLFAPMLDIATAASADSDQALAAWTAALPLAETLPDAAAAAGAAEAKRRELHPDAMARYDALRDTHTPTAALHEVGLLIDPTTAPVALANTVSATAAQTPRAAQTAEDRYAPVVHDVLHAELAEHVLHDQAWPALAGALATVEQLGGQPAALLATVAGERELASAKSPAEVLTFRLQRHLVPTQAGPPRTPTAADLAATSYPTPLAAARAGRAQPHALAVLGTALGLGREAGRERQTARASADTSDDVSTPHVDESREGLDAADRHSGHASADQAKANGLLGKFEAAKARTADGASATATAAQSYPTPIKDVIAAQAAPKATPAATTARPARRKAPAAGRRR